MILFLFDGVMRTDRNCLVRGGGGGGCVTRAGNNEPSVDSRSIRRRRNNNNRHVLGDAVIKIKLIGLVVCASPYRELSKKMTVQP